MELNGLCAVVTGAGSGIGRETALALAAEGVKVFAVARTEDRLLALQTEAAGLAGSITPFPADVNDEEKIHLLFEGIRKWVERLDLLVNNAGIGAVGPTEEFSVELWRRILDTNLTGSFLCAREAIRLMRPRGSGLIVNVASVAGKRAFPRWAAYCASKWGVVGLSHSLSEELRGTGIKVTALCPGAVDTPIWDGSPVGPDRAGMIQSGDIAHIIVQLAKQPPSVSVDEMILMPPGGVF